MSKVAPQRVRGLALPAALLAALLALVGWQLDLPSVLLPVAPVAAPPTIIIAPRPYSYRASGEFQRGTSSVDGPLIAVTQPPPLEIMRYQVGIAEYAGCVRDGACAAAQPRRRVAGDVPVTGVSFDDATAYAAWLSRRTGATWRLPSVAEWAFAAGSKANDPALLVADGFDPAERWLALYRREATLGAGALAAPLPRGTSGANEFGVADLSGAVWEWTSTCASRTTLDEGHATRAHVESCGARYLEGSHRTAMSKFVRDALGGGCSAGAPPDNLGFRLVREAGWMERLAAILGGVFRG